MYNGKFLENIDHFKDIQECASPLYLMSKKICIITNNFINWNYCQKLRQNNEICKI